MVAFKIITFISLFVVTPTYSQELNRITSLEVDAYEKQNWDKFFGIAIGYRKNLYAYYPNNDLIYLEAIALIRHCQFDIVIQLVNSISNEASFSTEDDKDKIAKILNFIPAIKGLTVDMRSKYLKQAKFDSNKWQVSKVELSPNRKSIPLEVYRSHVENLCKK